MSVLPLNWPDKVDSPELLAWLQQFGLEKYIDSNQINSIRDALNELYFSSNPDRIISLGTETIDGNEHTYEGYVWQLGGVQLNNIGNPSVIVIPSATVGFKRKDISVFTASGTIERVAGTETDGEVVTSPDVPEGTLYYKSYDIDGDTIGVDPEPPAIDGVIYKKKIENTRYKSRLSGENIIIPFQAAGQSHYSVTNVALVSVAGFTTAGLTTPMYEGQDVLFENQTGHEITLKDSFSVDTSFVIGDDLIVPNNGKLWFRFRNNELELIMKSWIEVDLSTKADLVGGKVPASQLPSYVDDVLEFANLAAFPEAGEAEKIYVALDTNFTYRWSGSVYVKISDSVKLDKSTTPSSVYGTNTAGEQTMIPLDSLGGDSETFNQSTWMFSDFYSENANQPPFNGSALSGGFKNAEVYSDTDKNDYIGSHLLYSSTTANSGYRYLTSNTTADCGMYAKPNFCSYFQFKIIGNVNNRVIRIGFHNSNNSLAPTNGAYLEILGNTAYFKTRSNSVETSSSSVILTYGGIRGGVYYKLLIEFISTTSVNCKLVDNLGNVVLNVNHTSNVPTSTQVFGCGLIVTNMDATLSQLMTIDYMGVGRQKPNFLNNF